MLVRGDWCAGLQPGIAQTQHLLDDRTLPGFFVVPVAAFERVVAQAGVVGDFLSTMGEEIRELIGHERFDIERNRGSGRKMPWFPSTFW